MNKILLVLSTVIGLMPGVTAQTAGNSLNFDGVDDHVVANLPNVFNDIATNDFTIEMWVNPENLQFCRLLFAQFDVDNFASLSLTDSNEIIFYVNKNSINLSKQSTEVITNGEWTHVAATWNSGTSEAKIYKDGVEVNYAIGSFLSSTANNNVLSIGSKTDGAQVFSGEIDEVSIYGLAREECDIKLERFYKRTGTESDLLTQYSFDDGIGGGSNPGVDFLQDVTGNLSDGTLNNFDLIGQTSNWVNSAVQIFFWLSAPRVMQLGMILESNAINATYQWINCNTNTPIPGATNININPPLEDPNYAGAPGGFYSVIVTRGSCADTSECIVYDLNSLDDLSTSNKLSMYPNPSNGTFYVDLPNDAEEVQILSLNGQLIERFATNGVTQLQIIVPNLNGMYLVRIKTQSAIISSKISIVNS